MFLPITSSDALGANTKTNHNNHLETKKFCKFSTGCGIWFGTRGSEVQILSVGQLFL